MSTSLIPLGGTEVLNATEQRSVATVARRLSTSLPPLMLGRVGVQVSKQRGKTVLALAALGACRRSRCVLGRERA
jgi:hypothetical protein